MQQLKSTWTRDQILTKSQLEDPKVKLSRCFKTFNRNQREYNKRNRCTPPPFGSQNHQQGNEYLENSKRKGSNHQQGCTDISKQVISFGRNAYSASFSAQSRNRVQLQQLRNLSNKKNNHLIQYSKFDEPKSNFKSKEETKNIDDLNTTRNMTMMRSKSAMDFNKTSNTMNTSRSQETWAFRTVSREERNRSRDIKKDMDLDYNPKFNLTEKKCRVDLFDKVIGRNESEQFQTSLDKQFEKNKHTKTAKSLNL